MILAAALSCAITVFRPTGTPAPSHLTGRPGLILSGGGLAQMPRGPAMRFIRAHLAAAPGTRAGNLLILKASGGRDYSDDFYRDSSLASVREIFIPPCAGAAQVNRAAAYVDRADAVLFSGGDQAHYAAWKNTQLIAAVRRLYARGGVEGGGSAGLAIQGAVVYDSVAADRVLPDDEEVHTRDATVNPYERAISFTTGFFAWPALANTITDTHFARRDRFGRLVAFMARIARGRVGGVRDVYGLGVDEGAVVLVDERGKATLYERPAMQDGYVPQGAWVLHLLSATRLVPGKPLLARVRVTHLRSPGAVYDLLKKSGPQPGFTVRVDGSRATAPYSPPNPYSRRAAPASKNG